MLEILSLDPNARVVVLPSDHHVDDAGGFTARVAEAVRSLEADPEATLLLGAEAAGPEDGYGWILPAFSSGDRWPRVLEFREKPPVGELMGLLRGGACLNTFVLVAEAWTLAQLVRAHVPHWFRALRGAHADPFALERAFHELPLSGFSEDVLRPARGSLCMVPLGEVGWSDIGTPDRLARASIAGCSRNAVAAK